MFVIAVSMIREGIEDYMRYRADTGKFNHHYLSLLKLFAKPNLFYLETNSQEVLVLRNGEFQAMRSH